MNDFLPFFIPVCGLVSSVTGALMLLVLFVASRSRNGIGRAGESASETSEAMIAKVRKSHRFSGILERMGSLFWLCAGLATMWFSDFRAPWILPSVGLFWTVIGASSLLVSFRPGRQAAREAAVASALAAASNPDALRRLRRQQWALAMLLLGVGIPLMYFSGISVGAAPVAVSQPPEEKSRLAEIVTQHVERDFAKQGHVGLLVGAIARDEEVLLGFGRRQLRESRPPDADTLFEIGSITKVFTGILLAQRIENGELELDDRIADLLPEGWSLSESAREVTLRHCTTHTSGFPRLPANLIGVSSALRPLFGGDPYRDYSEEKFREALAAVELEFEPGSESRYSNFAVGLLGFVLAIQNGTDYETLVTSEICRPLEMHGTVIAGDQWRLENLHGKYRATLELGPAMFSLESADWRIPSHLAGAGAIRSSGRDMMTFLKANMGLIPTPFDAAIHRSQQELFQERIGHAMGMNWIRSFEWSLSRNIIWHNGGTGGFSTYLGFTEDRQFGVFILSNTSTGVDSLAREILKAIVPEESFDFKTVLWDPVDEKVGHPRRGT